MEAGATMANTSCTVQTEKNCGGCSFHASENCGRGNPRRMKEILYALAALLATSFGGLAAAAWYTHAWWALPLHLLFWIIYYGGIELLLHCPRCPYWDDREESINCLLHAGLPKPRGAIFQKLLRYNPRPFSRLEQTALQVCNYYSTLFPLCLIGWALVVTRNTGAPFVSMLVAACLYIAAVARLFYVLTSRCCKKCLHFSCPVNRQPAERVLAYLEKNPELKEAWVQAGKYPDSGAKGLQPPKRDPYI